MSMSETAKKVALAMVGLLVGKMVSNALRNAGVNIA